MSMTYTDVIKKILIKPKNEVDYIFGFCDNPDFKDLSELKNIQKGKIEIKKGIFYPNLDTNGEEYYFVFMYKSEKPLIVRIQDTVGFNWDTFEKTTKDINGEAYTVYVNNRKIMSTGDFKLAFKIENDFMIKNSESEEDVCWSIPEEVTYIGRDILNNEIKVKRRYSDYSCGYKADFWIGNKKYYADVTYAPDYDTNECMIFQYGLFDIDWNPLYVNRDISISEEDLIKCINEFIASEK